MLYIRSRLPADTMCQLVMKVLLAHRADDSPIANSPHFSAIIVASLIWVFYAWATRLIKGQFLPPLIEILTS